MSSFLLRELDWLLLSLIQQHEEHAYSLSQKVTGRHSKSAVYSSIQRLEKYKLIDRQEAYGHKVPNRFILILTAQGDALMNKEHSQWYSLVQQRLRQAEAAYRHIHWLLRTVSN